VNNLEETIVAKSTPNGLGAIALIRLSGPKSISIASSCFSKNLEKVKPNTIHFGEITDDKGVIDEVLISIFKNPKSFTGEDTIEISTHGNDYIVERVIQRLILAGAKPAGKGEFTMRAFLNGKMDLSQAEAVADMIVADSYGAHKLALEQMRGGYSEHMKILRQNLLDFASLIELELDFGEEDVEFADRQKLVELIDEILLKIESLIHTFKHGNAIKQGVPLALVGRPNAGKSTLLNALLQENRAIVSPEAGTTRDTIEEILILDGTKFRLIDTAGIRSTDSLIEKEGIERTYEQVAKAEKVIYLFDPLLNSKEDIVADLKGLGALEKVWIVCNKSDLLNPVQIEDWRKEFPRILFISSKFDKLTELRTGLMKLTKKENNQAEITLTNTRHFESLHSASIALKDVKEGLEAQLSGELLAFHINDALDALGQITGNVTNDELLGNIFGRFCIGK